MSLLLKMKSDYINKLIKKALSDGELNSCDVGAVSGVYFKALQDIEKINNLSADEVKDKVLSLIHEGKNINAKRELL